MSGFVANHLIVDKCFEIPSSIIDIIKTKLISIIGESHANGYMNGVNLLKNIDSKFSVQTYNVASSPPQPTENNLRIGTSYFSGSFWKTLGGEEDFFTNSDAITQIKSHIIRMYEIENNPIFILFFAWCWDMTNIGVTGNVDSEWGTRWGGQLYNNIARTIYIAPFGLDNNDSELNIDTYLNAIIEFKNFCDTNGYAVHIVLTTGPVDSSQTGENAYQRSIKHNYIRQFQSSHPSFSLFDYADILTHYENGSERIEVWNENSFGRIVPDYEDSSSDDHISDAGALRIGKAIWWLIAKLLGWENSKIKYDLPQQLNFQTLLNQNILFEHELNQNIPLEN